MENNEHLARKVCEAFGVIAQGLNSQTPQVNLVAYCDACSLVGSGMQVVGGAYLQVAFHSFMDHVKVLSDASTGTDTNLESMLDKDIENNASKHSKSWTRCLVRVNRALNMICHLFVLIVDTKNEESISELAMKAVKECYGDYLEPRLLVYLFGVMSKITSKKEVFHNLREEDITIQMRAFIDVVQPVVDYTLHLLKSKHLDDIMEWK